MIQKNSSNFLFLYLIQDKSQIAIHNIKNFLMCSMSTCVCIHICIGVCTYVHVYMEVQG